MLGQDAPILSFCSFHFCNGTALLDISGKIYFNKFIELTHKTRKHISSRKPSVRKRPEIYPGANQLETVQSVLLGAAAQD